VPPKGSKPLRNCFTSFEFTATYDHIMSAFVSQGLLLELHNNDPVRTLFNGVHVVPLAHPHSQLHPSCSGLCPSHYIPPAKRFGATSSWRKVCCT
jgi:hypothetical protein